MCFSPEGHAVCVARPLGECRGADLVVHDSAQAHDADVDVVFLAHQSGVFQSSPARQRVATETNKRKDKYKSAVKRKRAVLLKEVLSL